MFQSPLSPATTYVPVGRGAQAAATWVWVVGGIETAMLGCAGCFAVGAVMPDAAYQGAPMPPGMTLDLLRTAMAILAAILLVVLVIPGIALIVLGFGIRRCKDSSRRAARTILLIQAALVGSVVMLNLFASAVSGQLASAAAQAIVMGGLAALQWRAASALSAPLQPSPGPGPRAATASSDDFDEPWNSHLPR